jgi:hypothetical protein
MLPVVFEEFWVVFAPKNIGVVMEMESTGLPVL